MKVPIPTKAAISIMLVVIMLNHVFILKNSLRLNYIMQDWNQGYH